MPSSGWRPTGGWLPAEPCAPMNLLHTGRAAPPMVKDFAAAGRHGIGVRRGGRAISGYRFAA